MDQHRDTALNDFKHYRTQGATFLLPLSVIVETGNHIAQHGDGRLRRDRGERFRQLIIKCLEGSSPWTPIHFFDDQWLRSWIDHFPDSAMEGIGLGDLSIIQEYKRQKQIHSARRVFIWSYDEHLSQYDTSVLQ